MAPALALADKGQEAEALQQLIRLRASKHPLTEDTVSDKILTLMLHLGLDKDALSEIESGDWRSSTLLFPLHLFLSARLGQFDQEEYQAGFEEVERFSNFYPGWKTAGWPPAAPGVKDALVVGALLVRDDPGLTAFRLRVLREAEATTPFEPVVALHLARLELLQKNYARTIELCAGAMNKATGPCRAELKQISDRAIALRGKT